MKDPKVTEMVKELNKIVSDLNRLNVKLYKQGVSYKLHDGFNSEKDTKEVEVQFLKQTVEY